MTPEKLTAKPKARASPKNVSPPWQLNPREIFIGTCAPTSKVFRSAGGVLSEAIRRLCVFRNEECLQHWARYITRRNAS